MQVTLENWLANHHFPYCPQNAQFLQTLPNTIDKIVVDK